MANVQAAEAVIPCAELQPTLAFFTQRLGFRLDSIFPAADPAVAVVSGYGLRLRLQRGQHGAPGVLRLACKDPGALAGGAPACVAPNGTRIELVSCVDEGGEQAHAVPALPAPTQVFTLARLADARWIEGRVGMQYRELVPGELGGFLGASHIRIPEGGPVSDYVHFHEVSFQLIYCRAGWVRVVYEDQGPPFVLAAGDCVLQPPCIRHRVLESSPGLEVVEVSTPREHETRVEHGIALPTPVLRRERVFAGQRFVRHEREAAAWRPGRFDGFETRDLGIATATNGLASACVTRAGSARSADSRAHETALRFGFVLHGGLELEHDGARERVAAGDAFVLPAGVRHAFRASSPDLELLEVALPSTRALHDSMGVELEPAAPG